MRDHPYHGESIMGGMFGIDQSSEESKKERSEEFSKMIMDYGWRWEKGQDQVAFSSTFCSQLLHQYFCAKKSQSPKNITEEKLREALVQKKICM